MRTNIGQKMGRFGLAWAVAVATPLAASYWSENLMEAHTPWKGDIRRVARAADGGYWALRHYNPGIGLLRLDEDGRIVWAKRHEKGEAFAGTPTPDGGFIIAANTSETGTDNAKDIWIVKFDSDGAIVWQKYVSAEKDRHIVAYNIIAVKKGGYLITGFFQGSTGSYGDAFLFRISEDGDLLWKGQYGTEYDEKSYSTDPYDDRAMGVTENPDGSFVVVGNVRSAGPKYAQLIFKVDENGSLLWSKTVSPTPHSGTKSYGLYTYAKKVVSAGDGSVVVTGYDGGSYETGDGTRLRYEYLRAMKLDENGTTVWSDAIASDKPNLLTAEGYDIARLPTGGYLIGGYTSGFNSTNTNNSWIVALDEEGRILWQKTYGSPTKHSALYSLTPLPDGILAGGSESENLWLLKLDKTGMIPECAADRDGDAIYHDGTKAGDTKLKWQVQTIGGLGDANLTFDSVSISDRKKCPPIIDTFKAEPAVGGLPLSVTFTCSARSHDPHGSIQTYRWDFEADHTIDRITGKGEVTHTYTKVGEYNATVEVEDTNLLTTTSQPVTVRVTHRPVVDALTADIREGKAPLNVSFECRAHDPDGEVEAYEWDFDGDGTTDSITTAGKASFVYKNAGEFNATVVTKDNLGVRSLPAALTVKVLPPNKAPEISALHAQPTQGTAPLNVEFQCDAVDRDGKIVAYAWDFDGDGIVDETTSSNRISHTFETAGRYEVSVTVRDDEGAETKSSPVPIDVERTGGKSHHRIPMASPGAAAIWALLLMGLARLTRKRDRG